jgi:hypothetical protein
VAPAGAIMPGVARFIVTLSAHADVFGVGTTADLGADVFDVGIWANVGADVSDVGIAADVGSMLVLPNSVISGSIVPGAGLFAISGVESGKAAPLVGGPPGVELHTVVDGLPSRDTGEMVPVVLPTIDVGMVPNAVPGIIVVDGGIVAVLLGTDVGTGTVDGVAKGVVATGGGASVGGSGMVDSGRSVMKDVAGVADSNNGAVPLGVDVEEVAVTDDVVGAADADGIDPVVPPTADVDVTGTAGVPGVICPVGVEQVTTVPGVVGSEASGTGASVVSGVLGWVVAENGLGP